MALIECPVCGRRIADRAKLCPDCRTNMDEIKRITEERENPPKILVCPECGTEVLETEDACSNCWLPIEIIKEEHQVAEREVAIHLEKIKCIVCGNEFDRGEMICPECGYPQVGLCKDPAGVRKVVNRRRAEVYLNELMAECGVSKLEDLALCDNSFDSLEVYTKIMSSGDESIKAKLKGYLECIEERKKKAEMQKAYDYAKELMLKADTEEAFNDAAKKFEFVAEYANAKELAEKCYEEAENCRKDRIYLSARKLMMEKEESAYKEAIEFFKSISGWKDTEALIIHCQKELDELKAALGNAKVGDIIKFGRYEQGNGVEPIEWKVLDKKDNKLMVVSKYALDCKRYNKSYQDITWENCTLRGWLNKEFISKAFSSEEQAAIATALCPAVRNPKYSTNPGYDTKDKIFLLSIKEAKRYFKSDEDRKCVPTEYAKSKGALTSSKYTSGGKATCRWWLRSPGDYQLLAASVDYVGSVSYYGIGVDYDYGAVRPTLWINLESSTRFEGAIMRAKPANLRRTKCAWK